MRIAYILPYQIYTRRMDLGRVLYCEALGEIEGVDLVWGGLGWPGFDMSRTVTENLGDLDAVVVYKGEGILGLDEVPVRVVTFNEAHGPKTTEEIKSSNANLIVFHHENDMGRWDLDCRTAHILHCTKTFKTESKVKDCIVAGVLSPEIYPLRYRLAELLRSSAVSGRVRSHPGYKLRSKELCLAQYDSYNTDVASARLSLTCSSIYKYPLSKIVESMALGTPVVCDMPEGELFRSTLGKHIIEISDSMSDGEIAEIIQRELDDTEGLKLKSIAAQECAREFTMKKYAERLFAEIVAVYDEVSK